MSPADNSRLDELVSWGSQHGATLHESVEVYNDDLTKLSLRVKTSAPAGPPPGFVLVKCPASVTLSYLNALTGGPLPSDLSADTELQPSFPATFMETLPPHVVGRFYLIQQYLRGPQSFWWPYIRTLPQPEHLASWALPAFWPEEDVDFLEGTNAEVAVREVQANVKGEFKRARKALKEVGFPGWQDYSRLLYNWAFCMFTSRSFRPTTVLSEKLRQDISRILPPTCKPDDFSLLMPVVDIANHSLTAQVTWDTALDPSSCHFVSRDTYQPGEQIFNNYGLKTNSELLLGYGFIVPETKELHNDYIHLRKRGPEGAGEDVSSETTQPKDFLVSLRPMLDLSSRVGRSRKRLRRAESFEMLPGLARIEDSLVWDLVVAQADREQTLRESLAKLLHDSPGEGDIDYCLERILASPTAPELEPLVDKVRNALLPKLAFDYAKILDVEVDQEEPRLIPTNQNQALAVAYRDQCKKVLHTALKSLDADIGREEGFAKDGEP